MSTENRAFQIDLLQGLTKGPASEGNLAIPIFSHGSLEAELYMPKGEDRQSPHSRDEIYVVVRGTGVFFDGESRATVEPGCFIFVPAEQIHRFEEFSEDLAVWIFFYGPEGGEHE